LFIIRAFTVLSNVVVLKNGDVLLVSY